MDEQFQAWLAEQLAQARRYPETATLEWVEVLAVAAYERGRGSALSDRRRVLREHF